MKRVFLFLVLVLFFNTVLLRAEEQNPAQKKSANAKDIATLKAVLTDIQNKIKNLNSYSANIDMVFLKSRNGNMEIEGHIEFVKPDKLNMELGVKGEDKTKQAMYSDGALLWQYMPFFKLASKVDLAALKKEFPDADQLVKGHSNIRGVLSQIKKGNVKYLGIDNFKGEKVYIFEGNVTQDESDKLNMPVQVSKVKVWVSTEDGLQRKAEYYSKGGELIFYQTLDDVKVNPNIPESEFKFQKPEGVNVLDSTPQAREMLKKSQKRNRKQKENGK